MGFVKIFRWDFNGYHTGTSMNSVPWLRRLDPVLSPRKLWFSTTPAHVGLILSGQNGRGTRLSPSISFLHFQYHSKNVPHSFTHSSRQPRYLNTHPSFFAGSFFARSPQESVYTTRTPQWKGTSKLFHKSNRPSSHSVQCSRVKSSNSHHTVSAKERKTLSNTKTLFWGGRGESIFRGFSLFVGDLGT
jgi:hypothetical protein